MNVKKTKKFKENRPENYHVHDTVMNLSLHFISQLHGSDSKAQTLLPWMIVPPNVEWRDLPVSHQLWIWELLAGLDLQVSGQHLPV